MIDDTEHTQTPNQTMQSRFMLLSSKVHDLEAKCDDAIIASQDFRAFKNQAIGFRTGWSIAFFLILGGLGILNYMMVQKDTTLQNNSKALNELKTELEVLKATLDFYSKLHNADVEGRQKNMLSGAYLWGFHDTEFMLDDCSPTGCIQPPPKPSPPSVTREARN